MKTVHFSALLTALALTNMSCEKVIDLELDTAEASIVIEGKLEASATEFQLAISQTSAYFSPALPVPVDGAEVNLRDNQGNAWPMTELSNGTYLAELTPEIGQTYSLEVFVLDETYRASSSLLPAVELIAVDYEYQPGNGILGEGYVVSLLFEDDGSTKNYYQIKHSINGEDQNNADDLLLYDDNLFNGNEVSLPITGKSFNPGDTLEIHLIHMDEPSFEYLRTLSDIVGSPGGPNGAVAAPSNPLSNWTNSALGFFSCQSASTQVIVLPE